MNIILYKNTAEKVKLNKMDSLVEIYRMSGNLRNECSIVRPSIEVQLTELPDFNYVYIVEFNRYYFVRNITSVRYRLWSIDLIVDVLMSHKDDILKQTAYISRNEFIEDKSIIDKQRIFSYNYNVQNIYGYPTYDDIRPWDKDVCDTVVITTVSGHLRYRKYDNGNSVSPYLPSPLLSPTGNFVQTYIVKGADNIKKLSDTIMDEGSEFASKILSIRIFPIRFWSFSVGPSAEQFKDCDAVFVGSKSIEMTNDVSGNACYVFNGDFRLVKEYTPNYTFPSNGDFRYCKPYSLFEIYLPFYGWLELEYNVLAGKKLVLEFVVDITNGSGLWILKIDNITLRTISVQLGCDIPISYTGAADVDRRSTANILQFLAGVVSGASLAALGVATANPLVAGSGVIGATNAAYSFMGKEIINIESGGASSFNSVYLSYFVQPYAIVRRKYLSDTTKNGFNRLYGTVCNECGPLSNYKGLTVVDQVHIEGMPNILSDEVEMLEQLMYSGIIL